MTKRRRTILLAAALLGGGSLWLFFGREPVEEGRCKLIRKNTDLNTQLMSLAFQLLQPLDSKPDGVQDLPTGFERPGYYEIKGVDKRTLMALDHSKDLRLCIDTDGDRIFSEERCLTAQPIKGARRSDESRQFGPISLVPAGSAGNTDAGFYVKCYRPDAPATLATYPAFFRTGKLRLAGRTYRVAVVDGDYDGQFHSILSLPLDRQWRVPTSDVFAIDLNCNGSFEVSSSARSEVVPLGKLVKVEDAYYAIDIASDGQSLSLSRTEPQFGTLTMEPNDATAELRLWSDAADQYLLQCRERQLPAGRYKAIYAVLTKTDASGDAWTFTSSTSSAFTRLGPLEFFTIEPGETTSIRIGPPFVVKADVQKGSAGLVFISPVIVGCAGEEYSAAFRRSQRRPSPIAFQIVDEKGTVLIADKFQYG